MLFSLYSVTMPVRDQIEKSLLRLEVRNDPQIFTAWRYDSTRDDWFELGSSRCLAVDYHGGIYGVEALPALPIALGVAYKARFTTGQVVGFFDIPEVAYSFYQRSDRYEPWHPNAARSNQCILYELMQLPSVAIDPELIRRYDLIQPPHYYAPSFNLLAS